MDNLEHLTEEEKKQIEEIKAKEKERKEKITALLKDILTDQEIENYHNLGESLGIIYGLIMTLEREGILKALGSDNVLKINAAMDVITEYTQKGIEEDIGKEKAEAVRNKLIQAGAV